MRKFLVLSLFLVCLTVASAPQAFGQVELFGGYSHLGLNGASSNMGSSANGWDGSGYLHLLGPFGAEADFSNHYGVPPVVPSRGGTYFVPQFTELYGPRFTFSLPRVHPFVHALFGTVHGQAAVPLPAPALGSAVVSENAFALAFGGGINIKATRHLWLRPIQLDYIRSQFSNGGQNQTRISAGLVFRFGKW